MEYKKTTIHDIAAHLGVTASTVSRALSDHPRISKTTKEKIRHAARELNYKPNQLAANLRKGRSKSIGVIVPRINRVFFSNAISGMESITNPAGYTLMICQTNEDFETELKGLQSLVNNQVDGIIMSIAANTRHSSHIQKVIDEGVCLVQFDRVSQDLKISKVVNDNVTGAYKLTCHLLELGYKKIHHFSGPLHINIYHDRFLGYKKAMAEAGLSVDQEMLHENILTKEQGAASILNLYDQKKLPEAIFAASDFSALGALSALLEHHPEARRTIEIAGFGNEPFTELLNPGITTVEQESIKMGQEAARLLINGIEQKNRAADPQEILIETKLIIRK
jgi:LacI family transcriptional regulator